MRLKGYLRGLGAGIFISAVLMGIASNSKNSMSDEEIKKRAAALGMVEEDSVLVKPRIEETIPELPSAENNEDEKDTDTKNPDTEEKPEEKSETSSSKTPPADSVKDEKPGDKAAEGSLSTDKGSSGQAENEKDEEFEESDEDIRAREDRAMGGQNETAPLTEKEDKSTEKEDKPTEKEEKPAEKKEEKEEKADNAADSFTLQIASGTASYSVAKLLQKGGVIKDADDFDNYLCENHYDHKINHGVFKIPAGAGYEDIAKIITGGK